MDRARYVCRRRYDHRCDEFRGIDVIGEIDAGAGRHHVYGAAVGGFEGQARYADRVIEEIPVCVGQADQYCAALVVSGRVGRVTSRRGAQVGVGAGAGAAAAGGQYQRAQQQRGTPCDCECHASLLVRVFLCTGF